MKILRVLGVLLLSSVVSYALMYALFVIAAENESIFLAAIFFGWAPGAIFSGLFLLLRSRKNLDLLGILAAIVLSVPASYFVTGILWWIFDNSVPMASGPYPVYLEYIAYAALFFGWVPGVLFTILYIRGRPSNGDPG